LLPGIAAFCWKSRWAAPQSPAAYLQDVLTRLPALPAEQLGDLLPDRWQAMCQAKGVIQPAPALKTTTCSAESVS
jgi:hypothetical protein